VFYPTLNTTNITHIPKGKQHNSMKYWRPIALCNVLYKFLSKVLAKRLNRVLHKCGYENQSTFVSIRSIMDNALVEFEVLNHMKTDRHKSNNN